MKTAQGIMTGAAGHISEWEWFKGAVNYKNRDLMKPK